MKKKALWLSLIFLGLTFSAYSQDRVEVTLMVHPVKLSFKAHKKTYYKILGKDGVMFVTREKKIYTDIAKYLPVKAVEGRSVTIVGASIPLAGILSAKQIRKINRKTGVDVTQVTVYEVSGYRANDGPVSTQTTTGTDPWKQ